MKLFFAILPVVVTLGLGASAAQAHERDRVTRVDQYDDANVVHYDHHHRQVYVDEYGNVVGSRIKHHDHHYVEPRRSHHHHYSDSSDSRCRRSFFSWR